MRKIYVIEEYSRSVRPDGVYYNRLGASANLFFANVEDALSVAYNKANADGLLEYDANEDGVIRAFRDEWPYDDVTIYNYIKVYECNIH